MASGKEAVKTPLKMTKSSRPATSACGSERLRRPQGDQTGWLRVLTSRPDRLLPSAELPAYTFVPGTSTPHPVRDPRGHSHNRKGRPSLPLTAENWADNRTFLLALDYFNSGFYWEAHEEWDRLWRISGPESTVGRFLRGLIKLAAAGVKVREYSIHGVRRHAASAGEVFADVAAEVGTDRYCGLSSRLCSSPPTGPPKSATTGTTPSASRFACSPSSSSRNRCRSRRFEGDYVRLSLFEAAPQFSARFFFVRTEAGSFVG